MNYFHKLVIFFIVNIHGAEWGRTFRVFFPRFQTLLVSKTTDILKKALCLNDLNCTNTVPHCT